MWLVVGLGNPGPKYAGTRHNIGFMVVDRLAERLRAASFTGKFKGELATGQHGAELVALLKPLTFMNVSGDSVQPAFAFYKMAAENVIVIHDELDIPLGELRLKKGGGHGGHNGVRHITEKLGPDFIRVRAGIGRPERKSQVTSHVLTGFDGDDRERARMLIDDAAQSVEAIIAHGLLAAQKKFHTRPLPAKPAADTSTQSRPAKKSEPAKPSS